MLCPERCLNASRTSCDCEAVEVEGVGSSAEVTTQREVRNVTRIGSPAAETLTAKPQARLRSLHS
eukprot:6561749-Prymnesium_polylepis.1